MTTHHTEISRIDLGLDDEATTLRDEEQIIPQSQTERQRLQKLLESTAAVTLPC
jgi:hypothetical protein